MKLHMRPCIVQAVTNRSRLHALTNHPTSSLGSCRVYHSSPSRTIMESNPTSTKASSNGANDESWRTQVRLAENQDVGQVLAKLELLIGESDSKAQRRWQLCANGKGIRRSFHFKTFRQAWAFMDAVAGKCKEERHHPEWWNVCIVHIKQKSPYQRLIIIPRRITPSLCNGLRTGLRGLQSKM